MALIEVEIRYFLDSFCHSASTLVVDTINMDNNWRYLEDSDLRCYFLIYPILLQSEMGNNTEIVKISGNLTRFNEISNLLSKFVKEGEPISKIVVEIE